MMTKTRIAIGWLVSLLLLTYAAVLPHAAAAALCNGFLEIHYIGGKPAIGQPASPGDTVRVQLVMFAGSITGGALNQLTVHRVRFDLDCAANFVLGLPCTDDGAVIKYEGNITASAGCTDAVGNPVGFTDNSGIGNFIPNEVVFTPTAPVVLNTNTPDTSGCMLAFDVQVASLSNDSTPNQAEEVAGYRQVLNDATCDNSLSSGSTQSSSLPLIESTPTPSQSPTVTPTPTPTSTPTVTPTATPTATATPEDSGFVPPDVKTRKCEDLVAKHLKTLSACMTKCQIKQADTARYNATHSKPKAFDEEACEQGTGKPVSCRTAYNNATTKLLGRTPAICPPCLDATAQSNLADLVVNFVENNNGLIYCGGTTGFGGDDAGFVPPDANTGKCEDLVAKHLRTLSACMTKCQIKQADTALYNATHSKPKAFDEEACEQGAGKPVSCRTAYNNATTKLLGHTPAICPPCLDPTAQSHLADLVVNFIDNDSGLIYCAGAVPLP